MTDHLPSLGEFLRQEREKRGLTVEQVASATKINVRLLHSLESDHYVDLPAKPFIRGFVTSYVRFMGLDPKEILTQYNDFIDSKSHDRPNREAGHSGYAFEKREGEQGRTILWFIMGGFVVLGGILMFFLKPALKHRHETHADKLRAAHGKPSPSPSLSVVLTNPVSGPSPAGSPIAVLASPSAQPMATLPAALASPAVKSSPANNAAAAGSTVALLSPTPATSPAPAPVKSPSPTPSLSPAPASSPDAADPLNSGAPLKPEQIKQKVVVKALEDIWVRYRSDDRPMMKFILRKDRTLVLRGERLLRVQVSNGQAATFNYNGRGYKTFGGDRSVATHSDTATLIFPTDAAEAKANPFPEEKGLPKTVPPSPNAPKPSPTPSP